jgi:hypothetical protein
METKATFSLEQLQKQLRVDVKNAQCYRDLVYSVLGNFSTDELVSHILTHWETALRLCLRVDRLRDA